MLRTSSLSPSAGNPTSQVPMASNNSTPSSFVLSTPSNAPLNNILGSWLNKTVTGGSKNEAHKGKTPIPVLVANPDSPGHSILTNKGGGRILSARPALDEHERALFREINNTVLDQKGIFKDREAARKYGHLGEMPYYDQSGKVKYLTIDYTHNNPAKYFARYLAINGYYPNADVYMHFGREKPAPFMTSQGFTMTCNGTDPYALCTGKTKRFLFFFGGVTHQRFLIEMLDGRFPSMQLVERKKTGKPGWG